MRGILALFDSDVIEPVNIGNPIEYTMLELAELVCEVAGAKLELVFEAAARRTIRPGASPTSPAARELLGWEPKIELREGLERTHAWYLEERARGRA